MGAAEKAEFEDGWNNEDEVYYYYNEDCYYVYYNGFAVDVFDDVVGNYCYYYADYDVIGIVVVGLFVFVFKFVFVDEDAFS